MSSSGPYRDDFSRLCGSLCIKDHNSEWSNKMFILDEEKCLLRYFNPYVFCPKEEKLWNRPEGEINTRFITKIEEKAMSAEDRCCFEIQMVDTSKHHLKASSETDVKEWIKNLHRVTVDPSRRQEGTVSQSIKKSMPREPKSTPAQEDGVSNGTDKPAEHISYETKIIGGVVVRKPVVKKPESDTESINLSGDSHKRTFSGGPKSCHGIKIIKQGFLTKKGAVVKNWKKRFFRLDLVKFSYYEKDTDKEPIKAIPTINIANVKISMGIEGNRDNIFEVVTPTRTFLIQAETEEEMNSWIKALSEAITAIRGRSASGPP